MDKLPSVAAVIVSRDGADMLTRCLDALGRQTVQPQTVILVDNGSRDPAFERALAQFPGGHLIRLSCNIGFAAANNIGVETAGNVDWVALLNNDAFPEPDWLETLLRATREHDGCAALAPRILSDRKPDMVDAAGDRYHVSGFAWRRFSGQPKRRFGRTPREIFTASATAVLYRRDVFLQLGGFDEDFFCYFEDVDFGFRLRLAGYRTFYVPSAVVRHIGSATKGEKSGFALYHGHRNLVWTFVKNMPNPLFTLYLPQHLLFNLASILWYAARGHGKTLMRAKLDAVKRLPAVWKKRKLIQNEREAGPFELRKEMARGVLLPYLRERRFQSK
jgi:GT2 family glycosyltransferase